MAAFVDHDMLGVLQRFDIGKKTRRVRERMGLLDAGPEGMQLRLSDCGKSQHAPKIRKSVDV